MAVIYKTGSKKMLALGDPSFGICDYAVPGLLQNKHFSITIPIPNEDENARSNKVIIVRLSMEEVDRLISARQNLSLYF
jgi:hypothetical protein